QNTARIGQDLPRQSDAWRKGVLSLTIENRFGIESNDAGGRVLPGRAEIIVVFCHHETLISALRRRIRLSRTQLEVRIVALTVSGMRKPFISQAKIQGE